MPTHAAAARGRVLLVVIMISLPLMIAAAIKYLPSLKARPAISRIAILEPHLIGRDNFAYLKTDVAAQLRGALAEGSQFQITEVPAADLERSRNARELMTGIGVDALVVPTLTVDAGIVQLNLQVLEAKSGEVIYNTPFESAVDKFPQMMTVAAGALKRAIQ